MKGGGAACGDCAHASHPSAVRGIIRGLVNSAGRLAIRKPYLKDPPAMNQQALSAFIWSVADLLRGNYRQSEYGKVILPLQWLN